MKRFLGRTVLSLDILVKKLCEYVHSGVTLVKAQWLARFDATYYFVILLLQLFYVFVSFSLRKVDQRKCYVLKPKATTSLVGLARLAEELGMQCSAMNEDLV